MALRSIANATITFGRVSIPVHLHAATEKADEIKFSRVHKGCGSRIEQSYRCAAEGHELAANELAKGYEVRKDEFVVFTDDELELLEQQTDPTIAIREFTDAFEDSPLTPAHVERCYLLSPDKGAERAYALLGYVLGDGSAAIAQYAARGKLYLVMLLSVRERLMLVQLRYADEVRDVEEVDVVKVQLGGEEMALARRLAKKLRRPRLNLKKYRDEVKDRVRAEIEKKVAGGEITAAPTAEREAHIPDLTQALLASLGRARAAG